MWRTLSTVLSFLWVAAAYALEEDPPVETNTTIILIFAALFIICIALYVWYTWKGEKKSDEDKRGDKF